ncbi:N-acetylglutaminylglutamine amidotransferase [Legionella lytica]|uniref:asparagine synthase (glutamine-hydrolyzing) n=1 Tax=Legionella lytica TaxID=96232 RepID=A0ABW8DAC0_9GAMM
MCGIAGCFQLKNHFPIPSIGKILEKQNSRGPDSEGYYFNERLILGHKRLKIIDLSEQAAQPMINKELGLSLVFNGEIYNFLELRKKLQQKGYYFQSSGDTEVILKAYDAWGKDCLQYIEGMFAFALWDEKRKTLILARDRLGIKPLYYAETPHTFLFASTLPALLQSPDIDTRIDKAALHYYLTFHSTPEPLTLIQGIKKLSPGTVLSLNEHGKKDINYFWKLNYADRINYFRKEEEWIAELKETLNFAIQRQFVADVPVGVFLSGGLDSSLLVALASQLKGHSLHTFSVGFDSFNNEKGDEFIYSDKVAQQFGTNHHKLWIPNKKVESTLSNCIASMSEPMVSHDNIAFYLLSQEVAKHVKVVLSGQGADEIFAGYHWFQKLPTTPLTDSQSAKLMLKVIADRNYNEYKQLIAKDYLAPNLSHEFLLNLCKESGSSNPIEQLILYESTTALANGPLSRVDNMSMSASLEARVPFLDEQLVQLAFSMPLKFKLPNDGKYILKQLGRQLLPKEIVDRPKGYFPVPAIKHLQGKIASLMEEMLSPKTIENRGIFNSHTVQALRKTNHFTPTGGSKLWQIALLEYWLQQQNL